MKSSLHFNWFVIYEFQKMGQLRFKSNLIFSILIFSKIYDSFTHEYLDPSGGHVFFLGGKSRVSRPETTSWLSQWTLCLWPGTCWAPPWWHWSWPSLSRPWLDLCLLNWPWQLQYQWSEIFEWIYLRSLLRQCYDPIVRWRWEVWWLLTRCVYFIIRTQISSWSRNFTVIVINCSRAKMCCLSWILHPSS